MTENFRVGVIGAGYVGLVTAACLSHLGHRVVCVEKDQERIEVLRSGRVPFYEPGLEELVWRGIRAERLSFTGLADGLVRLVGETDVAFIAVDTPQAEDGSADLSSVGAVARGIGEALAEARRRHPPGGGKQEHSACGIWGLRLDAHPRWPPRRRGRPGRRRGCFFRRVRRAAL